MSGIDRHLAEVRAGLDRLAPADAYRAVRERAALLFDTRPAGTRRAEGGVPGALVIERNHLEWRCDPTSEGALPQATSTGIRWIVFCDEGYASSPAAASLRAVGLPLATDLIAATAPGALPDCR
ncbi:sulfurtransferase [Streptomyces sp. NPDC047028]|uniref:rhodanese-like domain-containing protein n=1 Tax=Streptomyces sp. NPDC047028 TaxID=3155793 RepID=UPI0033D4192C